MSSGSLKDTVKAINSAFSSQNVSGLPEELHQTLDDFLEKRHDQDSQRVQEELLAIYNKHVGLGSGKQNAFASLLRILLPSIAKQEWLDEWWSLIVRQTLDTIGNKRDNIEAVKELLLNILVLDTAEDITTERAAGISTHFTKKTLDAFFERTKIPSSDGEVVSPEDEFIAHEWESVLIAFGRKRPKELLLAVDEYLVKKDYRLQALSLLSSFVRLQPPHLHLALQTSMIHHLLDCLLMDTSATVVDLALTVLVMFIPHITSCLVSILPKLLLTYARVLCWDQYYKKTTDAADAAEAQESNQEPENGSSVFDIDESWEQLQHSVDTVDATAPHANYLFTFLYGLFPLNFMNFVRKPRRYLKMKSYPRADDLDLRQGLIRTRTEEHRSVHLLHPSFFTTTPEDELIDNRWLKTDPADLVTECMGLCIAVSHTLNDPGPPPTAKLPDIPRSPMRKSSTKNEALLSSDEETTVATPSVDTKSISWRNTQSTIVTIPNSPLNELGRVPMRISSRTSLFDQAAHSRTDSPGKHEANDKSATAEQISPTRQSSRPPSPEKHLHGLQGFAQTVSLNPNPLSALPAGATNNTAALQREIMLLKNDLNFERYLKQQHLAHIGNLQRKSVSEATVASETENLLNTNRNLKAKLVKANDLYTQLKKETMTSRSQAKKYEEQLSTKLKAYREEEKRWQMEAAQLHHELEKAQNECEHLKNLIVESELLEQHTRNKLITLQRDFEDLDTLRTQLRDAETKLQQYELRDLEFQRTREDHDAFRTELETVKLELQARDAERDHNKKAYDYKISVLEARLRSAQAQQSGQMSASVQQMIDSALAGTNAKLGQLRKAHARLLQKYTDLELRNLELDAPTEQRPTTMSAAIAANAPRPGSVLSLTRYADDSSGPMSLGSAMARRNSHRAAAIGRKPHAFSDPSFFEENLLPENDDAIVAPKPLSANAISLALDSRDRERIPRLEILADAKLRVQEQEGSIGLLPMHGLENQEPKLPQHDFAPRPSESLPASRGGLGEIGGGQNGKLPPGSQLRVFGRGGVQNVGKKNVDGGKDKKDKNAKVGGFRGLRGIV